MPLVKAFVDALPGLRPKAWAELSALAPTEAQALAWLDQEKHTLTAARSPAAAFLWAVRRLGSRPGTASGAFPWAPKLEKRREWEETRKARARRVTPEEQAEISTRWRDKAEAERLEGLRWRVFHGVHSARSLLSLRPALFDQATATAAIGAVGELAAQAAELGDPDQAEAVGALVALAVDRRRAAAPRWAPGAVPSCEEVAALEWAAPFLPETEPKPGPQLGPEISRPEQRARWAKLRQLFE